MYFTKCTQRFWASQAAQWSSICLPMWKTERDGGSLPKSGRPPGGGNGNPFQYSCLENRVEEKPVGLQSTGLQRVGHD